MKPFLILLLLFSSAGFAQQKDSTAGKSMFIINGLPADSAAMVGLKIKKMDVLSGARARAAGGRRIVLVTLEDEQYDVSGTVTNSRGKPLAKVTAIPSGQQTTVKTTRCGCFYLPGVKAGTRLTFSRKGYRSEVFDVFKRPDSLIRIKLQKE